SASARRSAGRSRRDAAPRRAAWSRARWTARSGRGSTRRGSRGCGEGGRSTMRPRSLPFPSACPGVRRWPAVRRPSPARGSRWPARHGRSFRSSLRGEYGKCTNYKRWAPLRCVGTLLVVFGLAGESDAQLFQLAVKVGALEADGLRHAADIAALARDVVLEIRSLESIAGIPQRQV